MSEPDQSPNPMVEVWNIPFADAAWGRTKVLAGVDGLDPDGLGVPTDQIELKITEYGPGFSHAGHRHPEQIEIVIPITGRGVTEDEHGNMREFGPGEVLFIPMNSYHANHNPFAEELRCYIIKLPPTGTVEVAEVPGRE